nr:hypothetical protein BaRGS_021011 [Batillaria attramentaria]
MSVLTELDLKDNWLSSLPEGVADLEQLEYVRLSGNPFRCDCHTRWMKSWLLANQGLVQDWSDIKCSTDESEGRTFTSVADDDFICKTSASLGELAVPIAIEDKDIGYQDIQEYTRRWNCIHTDDKHFTKKLVSHLKSDSVIQENIVHAVETCTRSIVVLSDRASRDKWVTFAFRVAFGRQRQSRDHRVAIATHDDVDFTKFVEDVQKTVKESVLLYEVDPWFRKRLVKFVEFDGLDIC